MFKNSSNILFFLTLMLGVLMSLSSNNWMTIWMGMEISLMSFIPLLKSNLMISCESSIKYFIVQGTSSSLFILGMMATLGGSNFELVVILSMCMKMGISPFHNWVLSIIEGMNYDSLILLLTVLKLPPLFVLVNMTFNSQLIIILTLISGSILGLNQNSWKKIIAYSSIFNMGFILYSVNLTSIWASFFLIYTFMIFSLSTILMKNNILYINQMIMNKFDMNLKIMIWIIMLSLGGVPPLIGFMSKLLVLEIIIFNKDFFLALVMICLSLMVMFFYSRMCFISMMIYSLTIKWSLNTNSNFNLIILTMNLTLLPFGLILKYLT